jgi:hypothetical protein
MRIILLGAWLASLVLVRAVPSSRKFPGHHFYLVKKDSRQPQEIAGIRGGSSDPQINTGHVSPPPSTQATEPLTPPRPQIPPQYDYPTEQALPMTADDSTPFEETFQQKVDAWRRVLLLFIFSGSDFLKLTFILFYFTGNTKWSTQRNNDHPCHQGTTKAG